MYTKFSLDVEFKRDTPQEVHRVIKAMLGADSEELLEKYPSRWSFMLRSDRFKHSRYGTDVGNTYRLVAHGEIKNYQQEIQHFVDFILPHVECYGEETLGTMQYEEFSTPTVIVRTEEGKVAYHSVLDDESDWGMYQKETQ